MLTNVFAHMHIVLCNILEGDGGNEMVEENRGVKGWRIKIEDALQHLLKRNEGNEEQDNKNANINLHDAQDDDGLYEEI